MTVIARAKKQANITKLGKRLLLLHSFSIPDFRVP